MKNISRRVFIKGMAVAAAATAASTVLAGCNVVPGTEEPVAGFQPITKTATFEDGKTVDLTATSMTVTADKKIKVGFTVVNKSNRKVTFYHTAANNGSDAANFKVTPYLDDSYSSVSMIMTADAGKDNLYYDAKGYMDFNTDSSAGSATYTHKGFLYVDPADKDWKTVTLYMEYTDNNKKSQNFRFVLSK